jgi:hypothetical protein
MNDSILPPRGLVVTLGYPRGPKPLRSLSQLGFPRKVLQICSSPAKSSLRGRMLFGNRGCGLARATASPVEVLIVKVVTM